MPEVSIYETWDTLRDAVQQNDFTQNPFLVLPEATVQLLAENQLLTFTDEYTTFLGHIVLASDSPLADPYAFASKPD